MAIVPAVLPACVAPQFTWHQTPEQAPRDSPAPPAHSIGDWPISAVVTEYRDRPITGAHYVGTFDVTLDLATIEGPAWAVTGLHPKGVVVVTGLVAGFGGG